MLVVSMPGGAAATRWRALRSSSPDVKDKRGKKKRE